MKEFNYFLSNRQDGNISFHSGVGDVLTNRKNILKKIGYPIGNLVVMNQTHSSNFFIIKKRDKSKGSISASSAINNVDALITQEKNIVLMAQSADCPLLAIYNQDNQILSVIHSGWKGTQQGIIAKVLTYMKEEMKCNHKNTKVIVSPFAKACCYEVTEEFKMFFLSNKNAFLNEKSKLYFDLGIVIKEQLREFEIEDIHYEQKCTICSNEYFSYRKEGLDSGRFCLLAWMNS